jgi:hypothetical protein
LKWDTKSLIQNVTVLKARSTGLQEKNKVFFGLM